MKRGAVSLAILFVWLISGFRFPDRHVSGPTGDPNEIGVQSQPSTQLLSLDRDHDGLADVVEQNGWENAAGFFVTDPLDQDSDDDGLSDGQEKLYDTNPLDDTSPGIYVEYDKPLETSKYFSWERHGDRFIALNSAVVRRGDTFLIGGPVDANIQIIKSINSLTTLTPNRDVCSGRWKITIPTSGTVGWYTIKLQKGGWNTSLYLYVIFQLPTYMSDADIAAFDYSDDPANFRDEYAIFFTTSDDRNSSWPAWPPYHKTSAYGYAFQTDQYKPYVFENHIIDTINGYTDQSSAVTALGEHLDAILRMEPESLRYNMWSALHSYNQQAQCSTHASALTSFARGAGIPARPVVVDWDMHVMGPVLFDHSTEVWLSGHWKVMRAYIADDETSGDIARGIYPPTERNNWFYRDSQGDIIEVAGPNWVWEQMQTGWQGSQQMDSLFGNYNNGKMIRWNWLQTEVTKYNGWGWGQEPTDVGDPYVDDLPWPSYSPAPAIIVTTNGAGSVTKDPDQSSYTYGQVVDLQASPDPGWAFVDWSGDLSGTDNPETITVQNPDGHQVTANFSEAGTTNGLTSQSLGTAPPSPPVQIGEVIGDHGVDVEGNGRFDQLVIEVELNVTQPGYYSIGALIDSPEFTSYAKIPALASAAMYTYLEAGPQTVQLAFKGSSISLSRVDGPYEVTNLWVSNLPLDADPMDLALNVLDRKDPAYSTAAYKASDFDTLGAIFTGQYSEHGEDANHDGRYESMTIDVGMEISVAGTYTVVGDLYDRSHQMISHATWTGSGSPASLQFDEIKGTVGPYTLENLYLLNANDEIIDSQTQVYSTQQVIEAEGKTHIVDQSNFDSLGAQAILPGPYSDAGVDVDGDGRFDQLVITTTLVIETGEGGQAYRVEGWLVDPNGALISWAISDPQVLSEGVHNLALAFDGRTINEHGVDGPFTLVALKVLPGNTYAVLDEKDVAYTTQAYSYNQFQERKAGALDVFEDNMERGSDNWTYAAPWNLSNQASYSHSHAWKAEATGPDGSLTTKSLDVSEYNDLAVSFETCYAMQSASDVGYLEVSTDGQDWIQAATYTGSTTQWSTQHVDLSGLPNTTDLRLRFRANSQSGLLWYVDDVYIVSSPYHLYLPLILK
jgi:hypothetical protein